MRTRRSRSKEAGEEEDQGAASAAASDSSPAPPAAADDTAAGLDNNNTGRSKKAAAAAAASRAKAARAAAMRRASPLLRCLEQLDDAACDVLLPKLTAASSPSSVALTCSSLRQLVQRCCTQLNLSHLGPCKPHKAENITAALPERFPRLQSVQLQLLGDNSYLVGQALIPALARLPELRSIAISNPSQPPGAALAMLLANVRAQLPKLRTLSITASGYSNWHPAGAAWQQLGRVKQLTELKLSFPTLPVPAFQLHDLAELSALQRLQRLSVSADRVCTRQRHTYLLWLRHLTALTDLQLQLPSIKGLARISACRELRRLSVRAAPEMMHRLKASLAEAVGCLTKLTHLHLHGRPWDDAAASVMYRTALQQLQQLRSVTLGVWTPDALPVLASLQHLTSVGGSWAAGPLQQQQAYNASAAAASSSTRCLQVTRLTAAGGSIPLAAFPALERLEYSGPLAPGSLASCHSDCPRLRELVTAGEDYTMECLWASASGPSSSAACVAAVRAIAQLPALQELTWHPAIDAEVLALASGATALTSLQLVLPRGVAVTTASLVALARLPALRSLELIISMFALPSTDAWMLVSAFAHVAKVSFAADPIGYQSLVAGLAKASGLGLPVVPLAVLRELEVVESSSDEDDSLSESDDDF